MHNTLSITKSGNGIRVIYKEKIVLRHDIHQPILALGKGKPQFRMHHGNFRINDGLHSRIPLKTCIIEDVKETAPSKCTLRFPITDMPDLLLRLNEKDGLLHGKITQAAEVKVSPSTNVQNTAPHDRIWLQLHAQRNEPVYGGGEQYSRFNLRGCRLPLWVSEQGVGRAFNLTTLLANLENQAGGHWHSTYFPQPSYVTPYGRMVCMQNTAFARMDFRNTNTDILEVWQPEFAFIIGVEETLAEAVQQLSACLGKQPPPSRLGR